MMTVPVFLDENLTSKMIRYSLISESLTKFICRIVSRFANHIWEGVD